MNRFAGFLISAALLYAPSSMFAADGPPPWAYGFTAPASAQPGTPAAAAAPAAARDTTPKTLPGSTGKYTRAEISNAYGPADWYPSDHPQMPDIVAKGKREQNVAACSLCHYPNGKGRPENAGVSGLPVSYFIQTMIDFRNGNRVTADSRKGNTARMAAFAKNMTDDEIRQAAEYFGAMKWSPWMKVIETTMVPITRPANGMFLKLESGEKEPLGQRVIETPVDAETTEALRNPRSGFEVYVPVGSVKKGEALAKTGAGKTTACGVCHGADLKGMGPVPGLAGRSPSYLARQMYDMQNGFRKGQWTELMKPVVSKLTEEDLINIVAYTASLEP
ncbi:MAG: c-type cytochrome [Bryobacteraceae bacterium]